MEWFDVGDVPEKSGEYLIWSGFIGMSVIAHYSAKKDKWTVGNGWEEESIQPDQWAYVPELENK